MTRDEIERLDAACSLAREGRVDRLEEELSALLGRSVEIAVGDEAPASGTRRHHLVDRNQTPLSPRLQAVVGLLLDGRSDKEIAAALGLQPTTARTYVQRLCRALGVSGRGGVIRLALRTGLRTRSKAT